MRIRALANGNVIHADEDAAKQLIEAGIYEAYDEKAEPKAKADDAGQTKRRKSQK